MNNPRLPYVGSMSMPERHARIIEQTVRRHLERATGSVVKRDITVKDVERWSKLQKK